MDQTPKHGPLARYDDASARSESSRALPTLPLGGEAFASPLVSQANEGEKTHHTRWGVMMLATAALVSSGAICVALMVRTQRPVRSARTATAIRAGAARAVASFATNAGVAARRAPAAGVALPALRPATDTAASAARSGAVAQKPAASASAPTAVTRAAPAPAQAPKPTPVRRARRAARARPAAPTPTLPSQLTREQVIAAMRKVTPAARACFGASHGAATVKFSVVGKTGRVVGARVTGQTGKIGSCIARSVRRARFPKFEKRRLEVSYPFAR